MTIAASDQVLNVAAVLYRLMRDHVPAKVVEEAVARADDVDITDTGHLANHAIELAGRLMQARDDWEPGA